MKTQTLHSEKKTFSPLAIVLILVMALLSFNPVFGQTDTATSEAQQGERTVKGIITTEEGPVESASIILKDTNIGTVTNSKGEFTFPKPLKKGDVLLISYLGYDNVEIRIKESTTFIKQMLSEDLIEFVGALNTNKPYKSKRSKRQ